MAKEGELHERAGEYAYAQEMAAFFRTWIRRRFSADFDVRCDQMAVRPRGLFARVDTHTIVKDHRERGEDTYHFYLCNFRPTWTDCTCEGYHAENFGMVMWQRPKQGDAELFMAEKNCTAVSHELAHELLRQRGYKRYVPDIHDIWTRHFHDSLPFDGYGADHERTEGSPKFLTIDLSSLKL